MNAGFIIYYYSVEDSTLLQSTGYDSSKPKDIKAVHRLKPQDNNVHNLKLSKENLHKLTLIDIGIMMEQSSSKRRGITNSSYQGPSSGY